MKNLKLHKSRIICIDQLKDASSALIINNGEFCFASNQAIWRTNLNGQSQLVVDLSTVETYTNEVIKIVSYAYNEPWDSFIVGCSNGDVLLVQENIVEISYKCEDEVSNILCSPDFERIVLLSGQDQITLVTECFEDLKNFNVADIALAEQALVNVGWGKKETQFHGSEGKNKRVVTEVVGDESDAENSINICWRSDSLFFAIGYFNKINNLRSIKIFNRDGILQYISEPLSGSYLFYFSRCNHNVNFVVK